MQPCGKPCGSAAGFDFLTVEVIKIKKKTHSSPVPEYEPVVGSMFYTWKVGVEKHVQEDKKNRRWTELNGGGGGGGRGGYLASHKPYRVQKDTKRQAKEYLASSGNIAYIFCTNLIALLI